ncbi:hypothetical protein RB628_12050 [Streptomyces sp. ADMS]|uniref:hypothetical protein n=1 Tax=Streptomyces sp. ADMS TaxID=3071415 RepID=UPI00296F7300|nr:hypothetical protein [Streptomyces sp. ADMS]MDW4906048.1 hypothetical protein [Streptomyces sp. ADMS]
MTTNTLPLLPRRIPIAPAHRIVPAPSSRGWAAPTPELLRTLEAALARWSS